MHHRPTLMSTAEVRTWASANLDLGSLKDTRRFDGLEQLVVPIKEFSQPGDLLVLCPTDILHAIPLHAIELKDDEDPRRTRPIIERNPVVYVPSLAILRTCLDRVVDGVPTPQPSSEPSGHIPAAWSATVCSKYPGTQAEAVAVRTHVADLGRILGATAVLSDDALSLSSFAQAVQGSKIIHYHGHASYDPKSIQSQALLLGKDAAESLTVERIFDLKLEPCLVSNIACDSSRQDIARGDEPLGIPSAFLYAGATSIVGTLWPTSSRDGREFSSTFYQQVAKPSGSIVDLAAAYQEAVIELRARRSEVFHWASFVLQGLWFCHRPNGDSKEAA